MVDAFHEEIVVEKNDFKAMNAQLYSIGDRTKFN
jgi:hypothetical protein